MTPTLSINAFLSPEENRIKKLAYYGEFFANLDFDDGFKSIVYKALERYILSLDIENIRFDLETTDTSKDISNNVKVIIESDDFWEDTAEEILEITTSLQADFHLTPIVQNYPFVLDDEVQLPVQVLFSEQDGHTYHRYIIQKAQADIYSLEKKLERLEYRAELLKDSQDISISALIESWSMLIPEIKHKISNGKAELENLIATKYIEMSSEWVEDKDSSHSISSFQADTFLDMKEGDTKERSSRILSWIERWDALLNDQREQIAELTKTLVMLSESIWEKSETEITIQEGILSWIEKTEAWRFISAQILWSERDIYHNEREVVGLKLPGVKKIKEIQSMSITKKWVLSLFDIINHNDLIQRFYINKNGKYTYLTIEGKKEFKSIDIKKHNNLQIPVCGIVNNINESKQYFYQDGRKYKFLDVEGEKEFVAIEKIIMWEGTTWALAYWIVKNKQEYLQIFYGDNEAGYKFVSLEDEKEFDKIIINHSENGIPSEGTVGNKAWNEQMFSLDEQGKHIIISIEGKKEFKDIAIYQTKDATPSQWIVRNLKEKRQCFYIDDTWTYRFLNIEGITEFQNIEIQNQQGAIPSQWLITNTQGKKQCFYIDNKWEHKFLKIEGKKEFFEIRINTLDSTTDEPLSGIITNKRWEHQQFYTNKNGEKIILNIQWKSWFEDIRIKTERDWIPLWGKIYYSGCKVQYFYTDKNWKYTYLKVNGRDIFDSSLEIQEVDQNGMPLSGRYLHESRKKRKRKKFKRGPSIISKVIQKSYMWAIEGTDNPWPN